MEERKEREMRNPPPEPPPQAERPSEEPEQTTGGTGTLPSEGVPNPGFTSRGN
jgi:hypothetical protein